MTAAGTEAAAFERYWDEVDAELAALPAAPEPERLGLRSTSFASVYGVRLTSIGPYRTYAYYSVPTGEPPFPALLTLPGYGSVTPLPAYTDRQRYVVLAPMHRGQRLADQPFQAAYPGLLTHGIGDPHRYAYRGIVADCLRAAEFLLSRAEVDREQVAVVGGDLALITAARRPAFAAVAAAGLLLYRLMDACASTDAYPVEEVNDLLRVEPSRRAALAATLALFDPSAHAPRIGAPTLLSVGDAPDGDDDGWLRPLADALGGPVERYRLTHEGETDRDAVDAWLAARLGSRPLPRRRPAAGRAHGPGEAADPSA